MSPCYRNILVTLQLTTAIHRKQKNMGHPGKECQRNGRKKRCSAKHCAAAIAAKDKKLATTQAMVTDLTFKLAQAKEDLNGMAGEWEEAFGDQDDLIKQHDTLLLKVEVQKLTALVAHQFLAEAAPGISNYKLLTFSNEHEAHAAEVKAEAKHNKSVAQESNSYEELAPGTACLLNNVFVLANLHNDGYLSGTHLHTHMHHSFTHGFLISTQMRTW